ncbi:hypothetical protein [Kitasatospora acidiphila]|uniref:hypothetical protein n=1 Tax=Kitasatospora acidiphila TaxID=2567942 RepID=UPI003C7921B1
MKPERIEEIRIQSESEHRDHVWSDDVIGELLDDVQRTAAARLRVEGADDKGRTPADRIAGVQRFGDPITDSQRARATALLLDLLAAAELHGATLSDFDFTIDLPGGCLDVITAMDRRR